jgi:L-ascorbate metabolism protein UlaG (beta-lactamase superfamily)
LTGENLRILVVANCGMLIAYKDTKIIVDLLNGFCPPFDRTSDNDVEDIMNLEGKFKGLKAAVFTHPHIDHCDPKLVHEFQNRTGLPVYLMDENAGDKIGVLIGDLFIHFIKTRHSGEEYKDVPHFALYIEAGEKRVYLSGDSDFLADEQQKLMAGRRIHAGFFNGFYVSSRMGRDVLLNLDVDSVYLYHMPTGKKDLGIRTSTRTALKYYSELLPPVTPILEVPYEIYL